VMVAWGKRAARSSVLFPGPQPRSTMRVGEKSGPREVMRSWMGRLRASRKRRYLIGLVTSRCLLFLILRLPWRVWKVWCGGKIQEDKVLNDNRRRHGRWEV